MLLKYWLIILLFSVSCSFAEAEQPDNLHFTKGNTEPKPASVADTGLPENQPVFKFRGFGSIGVLHSSDSSGDYVLENAMPSGAGRSNNWDLSNYSKIGAQLNADITSKVSGQLQILSAYDADGSFQPELEWMNVKYAINQNFYVRVGRTGLPTFFDSGNHDVGYSYTWAHPPSELYFLLPIQSSDGIDAMYRFKFGNIENTTKAIFGQNTSHSIESNDMLELFDSIEFENLNLHVSYLQRNSSVINNQTGQSGSWILCTDYSIGVSYDPGAWYFISEAIQSHTKYNANALYFSTGFRFNNFTPYIVHSQNTPGSFAQGSTPSATLIDLANRSQSTNSLGVRFDPNKHYDVKFQYDRVMLGNNSNGFLVNLPTGQNIYGASINLLSAVLDFVF